MLSIFEERVEEVKEVLKDGKYRSISYLMTATGMCEEDVCGVLGYLVEEGIADKIYDDVNRPFFSLTEDCP